LKIGKYVEHLTPVSSEYLISCELLSWTSTIGRTSRVFLAYVIPWINKASLALYRYRTYSAACHDQPKGDLKFESCTALSSLSLWLKHQNLSLSRSRVGLRHHLRDSGAGMRLCTITTMQLWSRVSHNHNCKECQICLFV
jgi:hypothetical protein